MGGIISGLTLPPGFGTGDQASNPGQPPTPSTMTPQQKLQAFAQLLQVGGKGLAQMFGGGGGGPSGTPGRVPAVPNIGPPPVPPGSAAAQALSQVGMPNMTSGSAAPGSIQPSQAGGNVPYNYPTRAARNAGIVTGAINSFAQIAQGIHQKKFNEQAAEAEQVWQKYLLLQKQLETAKQSGDQEQIKAATQAMQEYVKDPKVSKILQTVSDPKKAMSPYSIGVQRAMQQSRQQAMEQAQIEKAQSDAQASQAYAKAEQERAGLLRKQAEQSGEVTDLDRFNKASEKEKQRMINDRVTEQVNAQNKRNQDRIDADIKIANIHAAAIKTAKGPDDLVKSLQIEAKSYTDQLASIDKQHKALQDSLDKNPITNWVSGDGAAKRAQMANLDGQRRQVEMQMKQLEGKLTQMQQGGLIKIDPSSIQVPPPPSGSGSEDQPIIIE